MFLKKYFHKDKKRSLIENTIWGIFGELLSRIIKFAQLIIIAKFFGVTEMGLFNYAIASAGILSIFYDFGILTVATKNNTRNKTPKNLIAYVATKFITTSLGLLVFLLLLFTGVLISEERDVIFLLVISVLISDIANLILAFYRANQDFLKEAQFRSIVIILQFLSSVLVISFQGGMKEIAIALILVNIITLVPLIFLLKDDYKNIGYINLKTKIKEIVFECIPFSGVVFMGALYTNLDILILGHYMTLEDVAVYSVAMKFILGILIVPVTFLQNAQIPNLVSYKNFNATNISPLYDTWSNSYQKSIIFGFFISIVFAVLSEYIIYFTFGSEFLSSAGLLSLLTIVGACYYLYTPIITLFIITNNIKISFYIQFICCLLNFLLLMILIPKLGVLGAVISSIATDIFIFIFLLGSSKIFFKGLFNFSLIANIFFKVILFLAIIYLIFNPINYFNLHIMLYKVMLLLFFTIVFWRESLSLLYEGFFLVKAKLIDK